MSHAYNTLLMTESEQDLQRSLYRDNGESEEMRLTLNIIKQSNASY